MTRELALWHLGHEKWVDILWPVFSNPEFDAHITRMYNVKHLDDFVHSANERYSLTKTIPIYDDLFKAFRWCEPQYFKVLILGQDPYPNPENATGIAFGLPEDTSRMTSSLMNLFYEIERSYGKLTLGTDISLFSWAWQGVLLLNSSLTLKEQPGDQYQAWRPWVSSIIDHILYHYQDIPVITFGTKAKQTLSEYALGLCRHIHSDHPAASAYGKSNGAIGSDCFLLADAVLREKGQVPIDWVYDKHMEARIEKDEEAPF